MLAKEDYLRDIRLGLSVLQDYLKPGGSLNLLDGNVHAEDFVASMLNALNGWSVKNTNRAVSNFPCLDLVDEGNEVGLQVTSEEGAPKINRTLDCLQKHGLAAKIKKFIHFSLVPKQARYAIRGVPAGITFDWKQDILDFDTLLKKIQAADDNVLVAVHKVVTGAMPRIFGTETQRLNALRSELHACLTLFDRELMRAPFDREDPVEMYKAIRKIRISLQKRGASRIANEIVGEL